jgi:hypothetical protein
MQWYEALILGVLQILSIFLVLDKLSEGINLVSIKSVYAVSISLALTMVFFMYKIDIGFLVNFIILYTVIILLFKLPIRETIIKFLIAIIITATLELIFAYILFLLRDSEDVLFNGLLVIDLAVVMVSVLINRFVEFDKIRQYILQYKNYMTISASTNLSEEEVERKIKEAEQFAEEDKKRKEAIETKNQADSLIYQSEKTLKEMEGKISPEEEVGVKTEIEKLKKTVESGNVEDIKKSIEDLNAAFAPITQKMYEQAAQAQQAGGETQGEGATHKDNVVDAEYEVVDEDEPSEG